MRKKLTGLFFTMCVDTLPNTMENAETEQAQAHDTISNATGCLVSCILVRICMGVQHTLHRDSYHIRLRYKKPDKNAEHDHGCRKG